MSIVRSLGVSFLFVSHLYNFIYLHLIYSQQFCLLYNVRYYNKNKCVTLKLNIGVHYSY